MIMIRRWGPLRHGKMGSGSEEMEGELCINIVQSNESDREGLHACMGKVDGSKGEKDTFRERERENAVSLDVQY